MKSLYSMFLVICALVTSTSALAASWQVPGDFSTIQDAIDNPLVRFQLI